MPPVVWRRKRKGKLGRGTPCIEEMWNSFSICAVAGEAAWPRAVSLAPCTMTKITLFTKNPRAEIPQSKAEAPPAGTDGRKSTLDQELQCGKSSHFLIPEVTFSESLTLSCDTENVIIGI